MSLKDKFIEYLKNPLRSSYIDKTPYFTVETLAKDLADIAEAEMSEYVQDCTIGITNHKRAIRKLERENAELNNRHERNLEDIEEKYW